MTRKNRNNVLVLAGLMLGVTVALPSAQAADITLTEAFQPGDYFVAGNVGGGAGTNTFYHVRPTELAAGQVRYSSTLPSTEANFGGVFNHANGDFFYWSGDNGSHDGYELRKIAAGQTTSTLVIANMASYSTGNIFGVAVASDNTVYALQGDRKVLKFTPSGPNSYNAGITLATLATPNPGNGATMRIITQGTLTDDYLLVATSVGGNHVDSVNTATGTTTTVNGVIDTGPFNRAQSLAIDYNNPLGDGKLRVLITNISGVTTTENTDATRVRRVTELAFDPVTGALSNPFVGVGNVPGNSNAESVIATTVATAYAVDAVQFDNSGNLVVVTRAQAQYGYSYTAAQLYPESAAFNLTSGATAWFKSSVSGTPTLNSVRSFDIAPIPEPATLGLMALGGVMMTFRGRR